MRIPFRDFFNWLTATSAQRLSPADAFWRDLDDAETAARKMRAAQIHIVSADKHMLAPVPETFPAISRDKTPEISNRAHKLLRRLRAGHWYPVYDNNGFNKRTPKAMQELIDAGLVNTSGRVQIIVACYVPKGYIPAEQEIFPQDVAD